jgi:hypothetical protein
MHRTVWYLRRHAECCGLLAATGLVYVVPSSMKQSSRQRLSPDLQDMEGSSGGVDWVDWVDCCPPQAGEMVAYQAFVDPTLCLLWAG